MEEAYITKRLNNWKKALEAFVDYQQSKAVPQCGDVLEMTVNDLNNKRLAEREYLIKVMEIDIQNELIELMAKRVLARKPESIGSSKFFGVIADQCTDISNKELLSLFSMYQRSNSS